MANLRNGTVLSFYYGSYIDESEPLTEQEMFLNANYITAYLLNKGWTKNAIAAIIGNMQAESTLNPGRWQSDDVGNTSMGYGLVQWTPATKYTEWCAEQGISDPSTMDGNLERILYELENNTQWIATNSYNMSFKEFSTSTEDVAYLTKAFLLNYERPADQSESVQDYRASLSVKWYGAITNFTPTNPNLSRTKRKKFKFLLFTARKRRQTWIN